MSAAGFASANCGRLLGCQAVASANRVLTRLRSTRRVRETSAEHATSLAQRWKVCRMAGLRRGCLYLTLGCGLLAGVGEVVSQDPPAAGVSIDLGATGGARRYRSGVWGVVEVFAENATDEPAEAQSVGWFVDDPTLQFGRRVMVPAHAILRTTCPIRVPELSAGNGRALYFRRNK